MGRRSTGGGDVVGCTARGHVVRIDRRPPPSDQELKLDAASHKRFSKNQNRLWYTLALNDIQNWNEKYRRPTLISSAHYVGLAGSGLGGSKPTPPR